jgi:DNA polymerase-3 subunit alpha
MTRVQHKTTKTGKPFGTFVLEDYLDSYEFALFGDDYIKFRNILMEDCFIHVKGNIEEKFRQVGNWDLRITQISLLSEMRDKFTKSLTVVLNLNDLNSEMLNNLQTLVSANNEKYPVKNCTLRFKIRDKDEAILVDMPSKSFKVNPSDELMEEIKILTKEAPVLA